jgi:hypothetical protein
VYQKPSLQTLPTRFAPYEQRNYLEQVLFDRSQQQHHDRGVDRDQTTTARQAAEALFTPKRQPAEQLVSETSPADNSVRKPRVLAISPTTPANIASAAPAGPAQRVAPKIPNSQFARIRAWVGYGMTARQVAEVYGVAIGEIERILRDA